MTSQLLRPWAAGRRRPRAGEVLAALAAALLSSACSSPAPPGPLTVDSAPGQIGCIPAPDPGTAISRWDSPVGFAQGLFYNQAPGSSLTIESVALLQPHNLALHEAVVYKMHGFSNSLPPEWGWSEGGLDVPASQWAARQPVPGALIPAEDGPLTPSGFAERQPDLYEIAVNVTAKTPSGGWALGEVVTYRSGGSTRTFTFKVGMAVAPASQPGIPPCDKMVNSIRSALKASG